MEFRFTKHARYKFLLLKKFKFHIDEIKIKKTIEKPLRLENKQDNTKIATSILDKTHVLRVVYKIEGDIIIIITFYPGRRKQYEV